MDKTCEYIKDNTQLTETKYVSEKVKINRVINFDIVLDFISKAPVISNMSFKWFLTVQ